jgi:D-arabinose 1-dehydrogenase-like Zn-dependent alcohol dehydrogenase
MSTPKTCRAAVVVEYHKPLEIWELPVPDPEPGAMVVKTEAATVCGTDIHLWHGRMGNLPQLPAIPGHEMTGRIVRIGKGVTHDAAEQALREGDRIVWSQAWCGNCYSCSIDLKPTLCRRVRSLYGFGPANKGPGLTGGMSEYIYVYPECRVVKVPGELDPAIVSSATCALRTVVHRYDRLGGLGIQENVVILGSGPIGLYALAMAIVSGAAQTIIIGAPGARLALAKKWGADHVIDMEKVTAVKERKEMVWQWTDGRGPDVVIECAGPKQAFEDGFDLSRDGARYLVIGQTELAESSIAAARINLRQVSLTGSFSATARHYYKAMRFLQTAHKRFSFEDLISNRYTLDQTTQAMESMAALREIKPAIMFQ